MDAQSSASSIAPIGIDVGEATRKVRLDDRRRQLTRYVLAILAACVVVLIGGLARRALASAEESDRRSLASASFTPATSALSRATTALAQAAASGTLRIDARALARTVWIDGERATSATQVLPCGSHRVRIGGKGKERAIDVPCGGEAKVAR